MRPGTLLRWYALKSILKSEIRDGSIIFDIGGYDGFISHNLSKLLPNSRITVVDVDYSGLQIAKKHGLKTLYSSALELPVKDNSIDVILCLDLMEHIKDDDKLIQEFFRVLKKNGRVILTTPTGKGDLFPFISEQRMEVIYKGWGHIRKGYSLEKIESLFQNNGLTIKKIGKYFNLFSRYAYSFAAFTKTPLKGKWLIYKLVIKLEPYVKLGTKEYIIIGLKL